MVTAQETVLDPDVLNFFAAGSCAPMFSLPDIARDSAHPFHDRLHEQMERVPEQEIERLIADRRFRFFHNGTRAALSKKAKEWYIIELLGSEIPSLRRRLLTQGFFADRPDPYCHPALADIEITHDFLVPLREFDTGCGGLARAGFVFSMIPVTESVNASYWLARTLTTSLREEVFIRLDPLLISPIEDYRTTMYKMLVYGRALDWDRFAQLHEEDHGRWLPGKLTSGVKCTEYVWTPRENEVHFRCEEIIDANRVLLWGCRYLHAVYQPNTERILHLDGALRFLSDDEFALRQSCHLRHAGKIGNRIKLFRIDAPVKREHLVEIAPQFFVWNYDIARYFGADVQPDL